MILGQVIGRVWSDRQAPGMDGSRFVLVRPLDGSKTELVAVDLLEVGTGSTVLVATEEAAAAAAGASVIDAAVIALVSNYERKTEDTPAHPREPTSSSEVI
jgi:ethanolamine utilization protein EutN